MIALSSSAIAQQHENVEICSFSGEKQKRAPTVSDYMYVLYMHSYHVVCGVRPHAFGIPVPSLWAIAIICVSCCLLVLRLFLFLCFRTLALLPLPELPGWLQHRGGRGRLPAIRRAETGMGPRYGVVWLGRVG